MVLMPATDRHPPHKRIDTHQGAMGSWRQPLVSLALGLGSLAIAVLPALAHGVSATYQSRSAIQVEATFSSGQPMADAQVSIFSPTDPSTPWLQGRTDTYGRFLFVPDTQQVGTWQVQLRSGGHGKILNIPISRSSQLAPDREPADAIVPPLNTSGSQSSPTPPPTQELSWSQKATMSALFVWGCLGTVLYWQQKQRLAPRAQAQASGTSEPPRASQTQGRSI